MYLNGENWLNGFVIFLYFLVRMYLKREEKLQ